uniref:Uncharacterized protein n=1 Tax=Rhizophora mucronata TaxID=61149 RepID=A0A2P2JXP0_RHIMU
MATIVTDECSIIFIYTTMNTNSYLMAFMTRFQISTKSTVSLRNFFSVYGNLRSLWSWSILNDYFNTSLNYAKKIRMLVFYHLNPKAYILPIKLHM